MRSKTGEGGGLKIMLSVCDMRGPENRLLVYSWTYWSAMENKPPAQAQAHTLGKDQLQWVLEAMDKTEEPQARRPERQLGSVVKRASNGLCQFYKVSLLWLKRLPK